MKYSLVNDFTVACIDDNGKRTIKKFTSHAQARQFVEKNGGRPPAKPRKHNPRSQSRVKHPKVLIPAQQKLKDAALKQLTFKSKP